MAASITTTPPSPLRPRLRWIDDVNEDIDSIGLTLWGAMNLTKNRRQWKSFIRTHRRQMMMKHKQFQAWYNDTVRSALCIYDYLFSPVASRFYPSLPT